MPNTEPNSLPTAFDDWQDWREKYNDVADTFKASPRSVSDQVLLQIKLRKLGFVGVAIDAEIEFLKNSETP